MAQTAAAPKFYRVPAVYGSQVQDHGRGIAVGWWSIELVVVSDTPPVYVRTVRIRVGQNTCERMAWPPRVTIATRGRLIRTRRSPLDVRQCAEVYRCTSTLQSSSCMCSRRKVHQMALAGGS